MNLASLETALGPLGWQRSTDALESPAGGIWLTEADLEPSGLCTLYASMARRAENALRHGAVASADELRGLLRALAGETQVERMLALHDAARRAFEPWATQHGMRLRFWDFSRASVRGEARHPAGGIACVEWIREEPDAPHLLLYHWVDEPARSLRMSWNAAVDAAPPDNGGLVHQLDGAVLRLLERRAPSDYTRSTLGEGPQEAVDTDYERGLEVLR